MKRLFISLLVLAGALAVPTAAQAVSCDSTHIYTCSTVEAGVTGRGKK